MLLNKPGIFHSHSSPDLEGLNQSQLQLPFGHKKLIQENKLSHSFSYLNDPYHSSFSPSRADLEMQTEELKKYIYIESAIQSINEDSFLTPMRAIDAILKLIEIVPSKFNLVEKKLELLVSNSTDEKNILLQFQKHKKETPHLSVISATAFVFLIIELQKKGFLKDYAFLNSLYNVIYSFLIENQVNKDRYPVIAITFKNQEIRLLIEIEAITNRLNNLGEIKKYLEYQKAGLVITRAELNTIEKSYFSSFTYTERTLDQLISLAYCAPDLVNEAIQHYLKDGSMIIENVIIILDRLNFNHPEQSEAIRIKFLALMTKLQLEGCVLGTREGTYWMNKIEAKLTQNNDQNFKKLEANAKNYLRYMDNRVFHHNAAPINHAPPSYNATHQIVRQFSNMSIDSMPLPSPNASVSDKEEESDLSALIEIIAQQME